jgi:hypothetical protein
MSAVMMLLWVLAITLIAGAVAAGVVSETFRRHNLRTPMWLLPACAVASLTGAGIAFGLTLILAGVLS